MRIFLLFILCFSCQGAFAQKEGYSTSADGVKIHYGDQRVEETVLLHHGLINAADSWEGPSFVQEDIKFLKK